jgi:pimeloyl-ACP methyl ester carboxylesterase
MQFFYQFPQRVERLVLISSGGLGREVSPLLRTAALPGVQGLMSLALGQRAVAALWALGARMRERGWGAGVYVQAAARAMRPLQSADARSAFLQTLRAVIDVHGQRVSATDRLYLLESMPTLIVWGERDNTIPLAHGRAAHQAIPGSVFRTIPDVAHFPHLEDAGTLATMLREFIASTPEAQLADADWGSVLARSRQSVRRAGDAAA